MVKDTKENDNQTDSQKEPTQEPTKPATSKIRPDLSHLPDPIFYDEYSESSSDDIIELTE